MAARNYFSMIEIEGDYITPLNAQALQQKTIPELLRIVETVLSYATIAIQQEAIRQLLRELATLSELCSQVQAKLCEIPIVYEGFHLTHDETSVVIELMKCIIDMIDDTEMSAATTAMKETLRKLVAVANSPKLRDEAVIAFQKACSNTIRPAA